MNSASATQSSQGGYRPEYGDNPGSAEDEQAIADRFGKLAEELKGGDDQDKQTNLDAQREDLALPDAGQPEHSAHTAEQDRRDGATANSHNSGEASKPPVSTEVSKGLNNPFDTFHAKDSLPGGEKPDPNKDNETSPLTGNAGNTVEGDTAHPVEGASASSDHHRPRAEAGHANTIGHFSSDGEVSQLQRLPIDTGDGGANGARVVDYYKADNETPPPTQSNPNGGGNNFTPRPPDQTGIDLDPASNNKPPELTNKQYEAPGARLDGLDPTANRVDQIARQETTGAQDGAETSEPNQAGAEGQTEGSQNETERTKNAEIITERGELAKQIEETAEQMRDQIKESRDQLQRDIEQSNENTLRQVNDLKERYPEASAQLDQIGTQIHGVERVLPDTEGRLTTEIDNSIKEMSVEEILSRMTPDDQENGFVRLRNDIKESSNNLVEASKKDMHAFRSHIHELPTTIERIAGQVQNPDLKVELYELSRNKVTSNNIKVDGSIRDYLMTLAQSNETVEGSVDALSKLNLDRGEPTPPPTAEADATPERRDVPTPDNNRTPEDYL